MFFLIGYFLVDRAHQIMVNGDSSGYYMHVVSALINNDIGKYDKTIAGLQENFPTAKDPRNDIYGVRKTDKGRYYIKYTIGVGVMELPGFLIGHVIALSNSNYKADGWSPPYNFCVHLSKVVYILLGFWLLISVLLQYFQKTEVVLTVISIAFGTNLFYQGTFLTLAHCFLFFDICLLAYLSNRFYDQPSNKKALGIGMVVGLITITRIPELFSLVVPLFWGIYNVKTLKERVFFFKDNYRYLLLAALGLLLLLLPQISYWYYVSGQLFFNPYQGEAFDFFNPKINKGWFSFQNGWLIYTPIMGLALLGFIPLWKHCSNFFLPAALFLLLNSWVHYSYYTSNYFPGLGSRPMIEGYPLLAFNLAAFFLFCKKYKVLRLISYVLFAGFVFLNLFQTWQVHQGIIKSDSGNAAFYRASFLQTSHNLNSLRTFESGSTQPYINRLKFLDTIYLNTFEASDNPALSDEQAFSGNFSVYDTTSHVHTKHTIPFSETNIQPGDWVYVGIKGYRARRDKEWKNSRLEKLVVTFHDEKTGFSKERFIKIIKFVGNPKSSIWSSGKTLIWGEAGFFLRVPSKATDSWTISTSVHNYYKERLYIDDLIILHYRYK